MSTVETNLTLYKEAVNRYAKDGTNYLFHNSGNDHALIICSSIFSHSVNNVRIAAHKLCNNEVVNQPDYVESMKRFLDQKGSILHIILTLCPKAEEINKEKGFYHMLYHHPAYKDKRIIIKDGGGKHFSDASGNEVNFCTGDDRMYRVEQDVDQRKAIANFGDKHIAQMLSGAFDRVFNQLQTVVELRNFFEG